MQRHLSPQFLCPVHAALLQQHQLASFAALWHYQGDWFEPPNRERGGWSGVNYLELADEHGQLHGFYLKRQEGHMRKTWRHPIVGEPTFVREFKILQFLSGYRQKNSQPSVAPATLTPTLIFFEQQQHQSILLTKALAGFTSADVWLKNHADASIKKKRACMQALAETVASLHRAGVQHRALYLKHLFVKETKTHFDVALIDFEKSRVTAFIHFFKWMDLIKLHQRAAKISCTNKLYFFKKYCNISRLSWGQKMFFRVFNLNGLI